MYWLWTSLEINKKKRHLGYSVSDLLEFFKARTFGEQIQHGWHFKNFFAWKLFTNLGAFYSQNVQSINLQLGHKGFRIYNPRVYKIPNFTNSIKIHWKEPSRAIYGKAKNSNGVARKRINWTKIDESLNNLMININKINSLIYNPVNSNFIIDKMIL